MDLAVGSGVANCFPLKGYEVEREKNSPWTEGETVAEDDEILVIGPGFQVHVIEVVNQDSVMEYDQYLALLIHHCTSSCTVLVPVSHLVLSKQYALLLL